MMEITSAEFITSQTAYAQPENSLPQIAVVGRSNVGKSSLINCLCRRSKLARVSGTPGKTRLINLFLLNGAFYLVDLPGYGFARVDKAEKQRWADMMGGYFARCEQLLEVIMLVDIRHEPTADDITMIDYLRQRSIPFLVVCTKADKVSRGSRMKYTSPILRALQIQPWQMLCVSSETGEGREALLEKLDSILHIA